MALYVNPHDHPADAIDLGDGRIMLTTEGAEWGVQGEPIEVFTWLTKAINKVYPLTPVDALSALISGQMIDAAAEVNREAADVMDDPEVAEIVDKINDLTALFTTLTNPKLRDL